MRILLATDAASEGIDLQNHCSRLFHYEIPWNPNRLEQRNGRIDRHGQRALLHSISEGELYESALTVMMRLVFLLSAEERGMLLLTHELYDSYYAVSTLLQSLQESADAHGEEVLGMRFDAWSRLLALFRMVYGGVDYIDLRLPAYGGRLFDPDRFPFLEGRQPGTSWRDVAAAPLLIDNRTVLHLLHALQYLHMRVPGGAIEPRRLSFLGLDIEQIGHVYEGLLDHTARRAATAILGLQGTGDSEPEIALSLLEEKASRGEVELLDFLRELTGRSVTALQKGLSAELTKSEERSRLVEACDNNAELFQRVLPYAGLLRRDTFGSYVLVTPGSVYVTRGSDRRSTGTHYTPRSLTEPIVQHALDPLLYSGPAEGWPLEQWKLHSAPEILQLKICDMAMGSGAFLVQSCRYLSEKLVEAWEKAEQDAINSAANGRKPLLTIDAQPSQGRSGEELLPVEREERLALARRLVSERCLYGVDKNPMAVEMAKLSLWLITIARNQPFTFLDHALRCGDSLLGISTRQLLNWSLDARTGEVTQMQWIHGVLERALATALKLRRQIRALHDHDVRDTEAKAHMLREADEAMSVVKLGADLLTGMALIDPRRRDAIQNTLGLDYSILLKAYEEARNVPTTSAGWQPIRASFEKIRAQVDELLRGRDPFHWHLEFPEVFTGVSDESGFDAIVGNPPFQGGQKITGILGTDYRDYLVEYLANGKRGSADFCAYFFLKATGLIRYKGMCALLATNTISQGDTREVGLDQIIAAGWTIPRAVPSRKWPGEANLEVAHVWLRNGSWNDTYILNDVKVESITAFLTSPGKALGKPYRLITNAGKSFQGSIVLGIGFVLKPEEAYALIEKDPRNKDVLFPYLNGEDLNSSPDQSPRRWIINFRDWTLEQAESYPDCMKIVREKVEPERRKNNRQVYRDRWWHYAEKRPALYSSIERIDRVLVKAQVSKTWGWAFVPKEYVYDAKLLIFIFDKDMYFTLLQSTFHWEWSIQYGTTLRLDMSYTPTTNFETFPFPLNMDSLNDIGERYYTHRQSIMLARQEGLTKTYNHFHSPREAAQDILMLRELHREMDEAVARAYGWDDVRLEHGFHETKQGLRYTISEAARRETLDRLLLLNHQRHEEEVQAGLFEQKGAKGTKGARSSKNAGGKQQAVIGNTGMVSRVFERNNTLYSDNVGIEKIEGDVEQGALFSE